VADDMAHNYMAVDLALAYVSTSPKKWWCQHCHLSTGQIQDWA
jgi:hypothetical protein